MELNFSIGLKITILKLIQDHPDFLLSCSYYYNQWQNVSFQVWFVTSKTETDIYFNKLRLRVSSWVAERLTT